MPEPVELIHLESDGSSLVVRILGRYGPGSPQTHDWLRGEMVVRTAFVSGRVEHVFLQHDLKDWASAIEALSAGESVSWMHESGRTPELHLRFPDVRWQGVEVEVAEPNVSGASVRLVIGLADGWVEDLRSRLAEVHARWPQESEETSPGVYGWRSDRGPNAH